MEKVGENSIQLPAVKAAMTPISHFQNGLIGIQYPYLIRICWNTEKSNVDIHKYLSADIRTPDLE